VRPDRPQTRETITLGLLLCCVAGLVDAVGYLTLSRILPANMSGNTVARGQLWKRAWAQKDVRTAAIMLGLWTVFILGAIAGGLLEPRWHVTSLLLPAAVLLGVAAWSWRHPIEA